MPKNKWHKNKSTRRTAKQAPRSRRSAPKVRSVQVAQGVQYHVTDDAILAKSSTGEWEKIASRIDVAAVTRDVASGNWGRLLQWKDSEDGAHECVVGANELVNNPARVCAQLMSGGLPFISGSGGHKRSLCQYILIAAVDRRLLLATRVGWLGNAYAFPDEAITPPGYEEIIFQANEPMDRWATNGTLAEWRENVGRRFCPGNSRLLFMLSCAFAGPLLGLVDGKSGGFHFHGPTSTGKTSALVAAGSVLGGGGPHGFTRTWRTTSSALEAQADMHNDATLLLDELAQVDAAEVANAIYTLGIGLGRSRMSPNLALRPSFTWRLLTLSTGEVAVAEHASTARMRLRGGAEVRMVNIPADAGCGRGLFENLHDFESADAFARELRRNALQFYGAPFRAFVRTVVQYRELIRRSALRGIDKFRQVLVPAGAPGEVHRVANRFAVVAFAGEVATHVGLTGWDRNEASRAARRLFSEWLATREDDAASLEPAIARLRRLLEEERETRFTPLRGTGAELPNRAGYERTDGKTGQREFLILPEIFHREICHNVSPQLVAKELERQGHLRRNGEHLTLKQRVPGHRHPQRVYCIRESILSERTSGATDMRRSCRRIGRRT